MIKRGILVLLIPVLLIFFSLSSVMFNEDIYKEEVAPDKLELSNRVIQFLKGDSNFLPEIFTEKETSHLGDVRDLIKNIALIGWICYFISIPLFFFEKQKFKTVFYGLILTCSILIFFIIAAYFFSSSFTIFHQIFFKQGTWIFSSESAIVNIYPISFFQKMTSTIILQIFKYCIVGFAVLGGIKIYRKLNKSKT